MEGVMPKINVYLPDDLAAAVKTANVPVSQICQLALAEAVRSVGTARRAIRSMRDPAFDASRSTRFADRVGGRMTPRLRHVVDLAGETAGPDGRVGTRELLLGLLAEGGNLALGVLPTLLVDLDDLRTAIEQSTVAEAAPTSAATEATGSTGWPPLTVPAQQAFASALEASIDLAHNYLGCEHLLLGMVAEPDSAAGRVLRDLGVEPAVARRAVTSALAGFVQARKAGSPPPPDALDSIMRRVEAIERRLDAGDN
ncbi:MAG TPA: Clp protease N-terminal domain-containing protein [Acidimicrobiia bacterium]|jgi:ATP-dependent Clp protease ATP-binding subunit ClpC|nr:Clp protease N-terminal domain-containing protein [Acidimicrobiia bacterium]